jgi:L-lactate permease
MLIILITSNKVKAHIAAIAALVVANLVAIFIFTMPADVVAQLYQAVTGFFPIGWIVLNVIFSIDSPSRRVRLRRCKIRLVASPRTDGCSCC